MKVEPKPGHAGGDQVVSWHGKGPWGVFNGWAGWRWWWMTTLKVKNNMVIPSRNGQTKSIYQYKLVYIKIDTSFWHSKMSTQQCWLRFVFAVFFFIRFFEHTLSVSIFHLNFQAYKTRGDCLEFAKCGTLLAKLAMANIQKAFLVNTHWKTRS